MQFLQFGSWKRDENKRKKKPATVYIFDRYMLRMSFKWASGVCKTKCMSSLQCSDRIKLIKMISSALKNWINTQCSAHAYTTNSGPDWQDHQWWETLFMWMSVLACESYFNLIWIFRIIIMKWNMMLMRLVIQHARHKIQDLSVERRPTMRIFYFQPIPIPFSFIDAIKSLHIRCIDDILFTSFPNMPSCHLTDKRHVLRTFRIFPRILFYFHSFWMNCNV